MVSLAGVLTLPSQLRILTVLGLMAGLMGFQIEANADTVLTAQDFQARINQNFADLQPDPNYRIDMGKPKFVPLSAIMASQTVYSSIKARDELVETLERFSQPGNIGRFLSHNGQSLYPDFKPAIGIAFNGKVYLIDGHHKALVSLFAGATYLPVKILYSMNGERLADGTLITMEEQFHKRMVELHYAYPFDAEGNPVNHFSQLNEMRDDDNLFLARLLIQKVKATIGFETLVINEVSGANEPLILKLNDGIPMTENYIAHLLKKNDIFYDPDWGTIIPPAVKLRIAHILKTQIPTSATSLQHITLLDNFMDLPVNDRSKDAQRSELIIFNMLKNVRCSTLLDSTHTIRVGENH